MSLCIWMIGNFCSKPLLNSCRIMLFFYNVQTETDKDTRFEEDLDSTRNYGFVSTFGLHSRVGIVTDMLWK